MIGTVPAGIARPAEFAEAEWSEAGAVVSIGAGVVDPDVVRPRRSIPRDVADVMIFRRMVVLVHLGIVPPAADQALK
jgi:hypothetical protein